MKRIILHKKFALFFPLCIIQKVQFARLIPNLFHYGYCQYVVSASCDRRRFELGFYSIWLQSRRDASRSSAKWSYGRLCSRGSRSSLWGIPVGYLQGMQIMSYISFSKKLQQWSFYYEIYSHNYSCFSEYFLYNHHHKVLKLFLFIS